MKTGSRIGPYQIVEPLGAGGMGEVYRARDSKLGREVALKVLPPALADDADYLARFQREAQVLASLNHPHIAQIYGVEENAIVMELVEGANLRGPLDLDEALNVARQIAEALEAAHERGIVHRDLKPANIKITAEGVVKVLDFGLAKTAESSPSASTANSPTLTIRATQAGLILGTAGYMSPEQAAGKPVDKRADIWAFGVVFWEMLTGHRLFEGETISHTLADVLRAEIDLDKLPATTPPTIRSLIARCLDRDVKNRLRDIGEARVVIQQCLADPARGRETKPKIEVRGAKPWLWILAACLLALAVPVAWYLKPKPEQPLVQLEVSAPEGAALGPVQYAQLSLSPDGHRLVFLATRKDGKRMLWLRTLESDTAAALPGTEDAAWPFWSPDSRWVGFSANGMLQKIDIKAPGGLGAPQVICQTRAVGGSWNSQGVILLTESGKPIQRVSASGGTPSPVFPLDASRQETHHAEPQFLPDGNHFLYMSVGKETGSMVGSLDGKTHRFLLKTRTSPLYYAPNTSRGGWLLYVTGLPWRLVARPFDPERLEFTGEAATVANAVFSGPAWAHSSNGILALRHVRSAETQLTWVNRDGKPSDVAASAGVAFSPRISPDQKTIAFVRGARTDGGIWLYDISRNTTSRLVMESPGRAPLWTTDGSRILYTTVTGLTERSATGSGQEKILLRHASGETMYATGTSRDGRWVVITSQLTGVERILLLSRSDGKVIPAVEGDRDNNHGSISPDGRWIVYATGPAGRTEVFVQSLPEAAGGSGSVTGKWQISSGAGTQPVWRADGKEVFYLAPDGQMMAAPIESGKDFIRPGTPKALFPTRVRTQVSVRDYDVSSDGRRFLLNQPVADTGEPPITVIMNWPKLLEKK
jgi:Tol biopolymer transport system component/predicted Ser/Thr protein kinase